jgi:hypothetical protein
MIPKSIKSKQYPAFIRDSVVFKKQKNRKSIFPRLGLRNCRIKITKSMTDNENFLGKWFVFSSSGPKGQWDIATMSVRGVSSCMRWQNAPKELIGSMVDPCVGIAYITDGSKTKRGENMYARTLVRYVMNRKGKTALLIEDTYTQRYDDWSQDDHDAFDELVSQVLKAKSGLSIRTGYHGYCSSYYIPQTKPVNTLLASYGDIDLLYDRDKYDYLSLSDTCTEYRKPKKPNKFLKAIGV